MKRFLQASVNFLPPAVRRSVRHVPLLAGMQRWLVRAILSKEPFVHTINAGPASGLRFEVKLPDDKPIWIGCYESDFAEALRAAVRKGNVCYDIGGYRGYMTGVFALAGAGRVVVFEPLPENIAALRRLVELNPRLPVTIETVAVGRADGPATFRIMPDTSMGKLASSSFQAGAAGYRDVPVDIVSLDTLVFARGLPRPDVMKIDVEGAELDVLEGATRVLAECRPSLYIEAHSADLAERCTEFLAKLGYAARTLEVGPFAPSQTRHVVFTKSSRAPANA